MHFIGPDSLKSSDGSEAIKAGVSRSVFLSFQLYLSAKQKYPHSLQTLAVDCPSQELDSKRQKHRAPFGAWERRLRGPFPPTSAHPPWYVGSEWGIKREEGVSSILVQSLYPRVVTIRGCWAYKDTSKQR